jgi:hypothetical protein
MILVVAPLLYPKIHLANAQNSINKTQIWLDKLNNIKVEFSHSPTNPITDTPTELKFDVLNLKTGDQLKNLSARVIILTSSNGEESFYKYTNLTAPAGNFSVSYIFPTDGVYKVLSKIESKDTSALTLASFPVFVSFQPVGAMNSNMMSQSFLIALLTGVTAAIVIAFFLIVIRKRRKEKKQNL